MQIKVYKEYYRREENIKLITLTSDLVFQCELLKDIKDIVPILKVRFGDCFFDDNEVSIIGLKYKTEDTFYRIGLGNENYFLDVNFADLIDLVDTLHSII